MENAGVANSWVDSYLEALLSAGLSTEHVKDTNLDERNDTQVEELDADKQIFAKYYVEQILNLDEESIKSAWYKASRKPGAMRPAERDARLEYLSWRVWFMKRKKEVVEKETAIAAAEAESPEVESESQTQESVDVDELRRLAPSLAVNVGELSDSSDETYSPTASESGSNSPRAEGGDPLLSDHMRPKFYCVLISLHGLVRGQRMELGKDADTGGQVKYVVELAKTLSEHPAVHRVELLTRLIQDPKVDSTYGVKEETIKASDGTMGGAFISRIECGNSKEYYRKEDLWPFVREFADNAIVHIKETQQRLAKAGENCELYVIHGHYADAGEAATLISSTLGVEMVLTGHSLGRNKLEHLLKSGTMNKKEIEEGYRITRRIEAEERSLDTALMVFTSTQQEIRDQWGLYDGYKPKLEKVIRQRHRKGRHMPLMSVIPPGLDFTNLKVDAPEDPWELIRAKEAKKLSSLPSGGASCFDLESLQEQDSSAPPSGAASPLPRSPRAASKPLPSVPSGIQFAEEAPIWKDIYRFLHKPHKRVILAMSRPDAKKNITTLVKAFGENKLLREIANLVLVMGNREIIDSMASGSRKVLEQVLKLIDAYNLYGSVAYPKRHTQNDISDIYLLATATRGAFVNIAYQEPFGLTLIEAAAHGVPIVATKNGGPVDIIHTLRNGILVDPGDSGATATALLRILTHSQLWEKFSSNGVNNIHAYAWPMHCVKYLRQIEQEKRTVQRRKRSRVMATLSACLDDFALNIDPPVHTVTSFPALSGAQRGGGSDDEREHERTSESSLPTTASRSFSAELPNMQQRSRTESGTGAQNEEGTRGSSQLQGVKDKYIVLALNSTKDVPTLAHTLSKQGRKLLGLNKSGVGIGVISVFNQGDTCAKLREAELDPKDVDFLVCNAGSEIWYTRDTKEPVFDEAFEQHIEFHWDKHAVKRNLAQCLTYLITSSAKANRSGALSFKDLWSKVQIDTNEGSHHVAATMHGLGNVDDVIGNAKHVLAKVRRKFRSIGIRVQLLLQLDKVEDANVLRVHVTPLRATRALAMRFMAYRHGVPLTNLVVVCAANVAEKPVISMCTSDAEDLVAGVPGVVLVPAREEDEKDKAFAVDTVVYEGERLQIVDK